MTFKAALTAMLALASVQAYPQSLNDPDYVGGFEAWKARDYETAAERLARYRLGQLYARTYDVDYWLGTSLCRLGDSRRAVGFDLLDWAFRFSDMPEAERPKFKVERDRCKGSTAAPFARPASVVAVALAPSTSRGEGKTYTLGPDGMNAYPLRVKRPVSAKELRARLVKRGEEGKAVAAIRARAPKAVTLAHGRFVIASLAGHSPAALGQIGARLEEFVSFLEREYGAKLPQYLYSVYLVPDGAELRLIADRLHGIDASPAALGYSFQNDLSVVGVLTGTGAGTLFHELFHVVVRATYADIPQWLDEGMASLYETSTFVGNRYLGEPNWRSRVLNNLGNPPLASLIQAPWFSDEPIPEGSRPVVRDEQAMLLAKARYFAMFLQEEGKLRKMFIAFRDRQPLAPWMPAEDQAMALVQEIGGASIDVLDDRFGKWYRAKGADPTGRLH